MKSLSWDISKMHQNYAENLHRRANATQTSISFHTSDLPALPVLTSWVWLTAPVLPHFSWQGVSHPTHPGQKGECKVTAMKSLAVSGMRTHHHTEEWKPIFSLTEELVVSPVMELHHTDRYLFSSSVRNTNWSRGTLITSPLWQFKGCTVINLIQMFRHLLIADVFNFLLTKQNKKPLLSILPPYLYWKQLPKISIKSDFVQLNKWYDIWMQALNYE